MSKQEQYNQLVKEFMNHEFNGRYSEWLNPYKIDGFDFEAVCKEHIGCPQINPWSLWQNCLSPDILVIGKDWGSAYKVDEGLVDVSKALLDGRFDDIPMQTDIKLRDCFSVMGWKISEPYRKDTENKLFFTNAILGIRNHCCPIKVQELGI